MASELASMYVSITPNMSGFRTSVLKELRGVDVDAGSVGASSGHAFSGAFSRAVGGLGQALATTLKVGTGAALAGIAAAGTVGIKTAAQLETAQIGFTTMLGSGEKAQAFLKDLTSFAAKTPFELPGLQKSASQLVATGIETQKVIPIMTTLGNITSGMGTGSEGISRAVVAIQQMNAAQKITAEDLNQLRDAGVPVFELLSTATGKSTKEIAGMAAAGKLGKTELDALMTTLESGAGLERFNGLMEKQSQSLSGLASTAKDTFSIGMAGAIEPLIPLLKDGLGGAISWMSGKLFPAVTFGLSETIGSVKAFAGAWKANDGDITSSGMPGFFERLGFWGHQAFDGMRSALEPLRPVWDAIVDAFKGLVPIFAPLVPQIFAMVTAFNPLSLLFKALQPVLPTIIAALGNLGAVVGGVLVQVLPIVTGVLAQLVGILIGSLAQILPTVVMLVTSLAAIFAMLAPLVVHIVEAFAPLIAHLVQSFAPIIVSLVNAILPPLIAILAAIVSAIVPLVTILIDILVPIIQNILVPVITVAFAVIAEIIKVAMAVVMVIIAGLVWYFQNVLAPVFNWLWQNIVKPVWEGISAAIGTAWTWIDTNVFKPIGVAIGILGTGFDTFWHNTIEPVWEGIQDTLGTGWTWIKTNVFDPISKFITETIPKAFEDGIKAVSKAWDDIAKLAKAPIDFVVNTILNNGILAAVNTVARFFNPSHTDYKIDWPPSGWGSYEVGGYTGAGGRLDPAGIVHAGEIVWSQSDIARWGGVGVVESLRNARGYAGGGLVSPLDSYVLTQGFSGLLGHNGIDMAAPTGTPVKAAGPGVVSMAGWSPFGGGNEIHIDHPNGLQTWYAHLNGFNVGNGATVNQGQTIGPVGSTGLSTGPHLHYMVLDGGWPFVLNPMDYLSGGGNAGSGAGAIFNPLAGLLDGFLADITKNFPGAGVMLDIVTGATKKVFDEGMSFIGGLFTGSTDKKGPQGRALGSPTLFDNGGWLERTAEPFLMQHKRREPDAVLRNSDWNNISTLSEKAMKDMAKGDSGAALAEALENAQLELVGMNALSDSVAARIRLARSRRV